MKSELKGINYKIFDSHEKFSKLKRRLTWVVFTCPKNPLLARRRQFELSFQLSPRTFRSNYESRIRITAFYASLEQPFHLTAFLFAFQEDCDVEWKFARTKLWLNFIDNGSTLPVPFNIIPTPMTCVNSVQFIKKFLSDESVFITSQPRSNAFMRVSVKAASRGGNFGFSSRRKRCFIADFSHEIVTPRWPLSLFSPLLLIPRIECRFFIENPYMRSSGTEVCFVVVNIYT